MSDESLPPPLFEFSDFAAAISPPRSAHEPELRLLGDPATYPPLPTRWDGDAVRWDHWVEMPVTSIEFHDRPYQCEDCGTTARPYTSLGRRQPGKGEVFETIRRHRTIRARWGRTYRIPIRDHVPAWPIINWYATRCGWCGRTEVYDLHSREHWILDDADYGPTGSNRPTDTPHPDALAAVGLFD